MARQAGVTVQDYQVKLEANPQSLVFSRLADGFRKKGEIQQAISICTQGLQLHPDYVTGRVILGRCFLEQEKLKEAIAEFVRVVDLDRRNQVAIKMIADIFVRQGMKEKAGDLYACLLGMDPENQSLLKLAQANPGNGEKNIRRILGIASGAPISIESEESVQLVPHVSADTIIDADKTMRMDIVSRQPEGRLGDAAELGEMLVKTQKFDTEELNTAADIGDSYRVTETISDKPAKEIDQITGDDVSSRMEMIFGEEDAPKTEAGLESATLPSESMDVVPDMMPEDLGKKVSDDTVAGPLDTKESIAAPVVSGSDITSRIEQLFGDETLPAKPEASVSGPPESPEPRVQDEKQGEIESLSGKDVTDRLNEMFSDSDPSSLTGPLAEIGKLLDLHMPSIDKEEPTVPGSEMHDDLTTEPVNVGALTPGSPQIDEQEIVRGETPEAVSGDDIALRLETIFNEEEKQEEATDAGAITVSEDSETHPEEDTRFPVEIHDQPIVISGDISDTDIHDQGEATLFGTETMAEDLGRPEPAETISAGPSTVAQPEAEIDDAVEQEEQPEMSGDDVVGRLEELFSEDLAKDGGLESIPEGEKDDGDVNQGFYTMSGENAQTAASDEGLLSELDKSDSEDQEKEYSGTMRGSEDKTVLMDQDGGDLTLAVAEDETIMADSQARLPEQPALRVTAEPAADSDDDVVVSEATQIRLPASDQMAPPPEADEDTVTQYSIPNHVLTPTLADIYYQQGQPKLALQIYNRLLEADPDNERIAQRVREIERACAAAERETAETSVLDSEKKRTIAPRLEPVEQPPTQRKTPGGAAGKPLAGVRIKKIYKNRRKKNK